MASKIRTVRLSDGEVKALEHLATRVGSLAPTGPRAGKGSIATLLHDIAAANLVVLHPDDLGYNIPADE